MQTDRQIRGRARRQAQLQFGPERRGLKAQLRDRKRQRNFETRAARSTGEMHAEIARSSKSGLRKTYDEGEARQADAEKFLASTGANTHAGNALSVALAGTSTRARQDLAASRTQALEDADQEAVRAIEGIAFAIKAAQAGYEDDAAKIFEQIRGNLRDQGLATSNNYEELWDAEQAARLDEARLAETMRHNRATESISRDKARNRKKGTGLLTPGQSNTEVDRINEAREWIRRMSTGPKGLSSTQIRQRLRSGAKGTDSKGTAFEIPKFSKDHINAAYDLETHGILSPENGRRLRSRGVKVPRSWKPHTAKPTNPKFKGPMPGEKGSRKR